MGWLYEAPPYCTFVKLADWLINVKRFASPGSWRWRFPALSAKMSSREAAMKVPLLCFDMGSLELAS
jgi:hypothetical protein